MQSIECIFCKIIAKQVPSMLIDEDDEIIVIKDIAPKAAIHYLIIPKLHIKDIQSLTDQDIHLAGKLVMKAQELSKKLPAPGDFRLVCNSGAYAGQKVFHVHFHFLAGQKMTDF